MSRREYRTDAPRRVSAAGHDLFEPLEIRLREVPVEAPSSAACTSESWPESLIAIRRTPSRLGFASDASGEIDAARHRTRDPRQQPGR
jgi:hypothetical protein